MVMLAFSSAVVHAALLVPLFRGPVALHSISRSTAVRMLDEKDIPEAFKRKNKPMPPPEIRLVDREGDDVRFVMQNGSMTLFVAGELFCESIDTLTYSRDDGVVTVEDEEMEGSFAIREEEQLMKAATLAVYGRQCNIEWQGDEPVALPDEVERLLVDDELKESRAGVRLLWAHLLEVYPSEQAALAAVERNSAVVLPYLNRPHHIEGSWRVLNEMMDPAEALDVVTKNPGLLSCDPTGLKGSNKATVQAMANVVNGVESSFVPVWKSLWEKKP